MVEIGLVWGIGMEFDEDGISDGGIELDCGGGGMSNVVGGNWVIVGCGCGCG